MSPPESPKHRLEGRRRAGLPSALALLLLGVLALALVAPTHAVILERMLTLDPKSAPPGSQVVATASGFGSCPPVDDVTGGTGSVAFGFDGFEVATAPVIGDTATAPFTVPQDAAVGDHRVLALCLGNKTITAAEGFVVTAPPEPVVEAVLVPDLVGRSLEEARVVLAEVGLELGDVFGEDGLVEDQVPAADTQALPGDRVSVVLAGLVTVPPLAGLTLEEASRILVERGLVLGEVTGGGDTVSTQTPAEGTGVPRGSAVSIDFESVVPPVVPTVAVPPLKGLTIDQAREVLSDRGLTLADVGIEGEVEGTIATQTPPSGALVPVDSSVAVTLLAATSSGFGPEEWAATAAFLVLLGAASALGIRGTRTRRARRWVRSHVEVVANPTPPPLSVPAAPRPGLTPPDHVVRIEPHPDSGAHVLEEVRR